MTSRLLRVAAILTIFLGLCGLSLLSENALLSAREVRMFPEVDTSSPLAENQQQEISRTITTERFSFLIVELPFKDIEEFSTQSNATMIKTRDFLMIVEKKRVRFEFEPGDLIAHIALFDTQARITGLLPSFMAISSDAIWNVSNRASTYICSLHTAVCNAILAGLMAEGETEFISDGVHLTGNFDIGVVDTRSDFSNDFITVWESDLTVHGQIVITPVPTTIFIPAK